MACDMDVDNAGVAYTSYAFPLDNSEAADFEGVGVGNNSDRDDDNDGMPDNWELSNQLDPFDASDAANDSDGDGYTNLAEYRAGSDPHVSDSIPRTLTPNEVMSWMNLLLRKQQN
jgi:hypothetical protein